MLADAFNNRENSLLRKQAKLAKKHNKNIARWIRALLSGKYKQAFDEFTKAHWYAVSNKRYYSERCYCATGVALAEFGCLRVGNSFLLINGEHVDDWFHKKFGNDIHWWKIAGMNDDGQSFAEIACYLSHFLLDGTEKAELQEIIMQKLDAQEAMRREHEEAHAKLRELLKGYKVSSLEISGDRSADKEVQ